MSSSNGKFESCSHRYAEAKVEKEGDSLSLTLSVDGERSGPCASLALKTPALTRDALLTMAEILTSDSRFKASDRSDYLAYLLKQGQRATKELWEAQQAFLESKYSEEIDDEAPLDPVLTISDESVSLEVFSADESAYARLELKADKAYKASKVTTGTTHIDLASARDGLAQLRSHRGATLAFENLSGGVESSNNDEEGLSERSIKVPYRWVRALGQMQAASTLPATRFSIAPVDLYNVLFTLRTQRAKTSPRALRYELVPGQVPRIVLEPWDLVIEGSSGKYEGDIPAIIRTWGRRRLSFLSRLLPHIQSVEVHLVGAGLPAFYVFDLGEATLTLAMSGWTDAGWAGIATFDLFGAEVDKGLVKKVSKALDKAPATLSELADKTNAGESELRNAVLSLMQNGTIINDLASGRFILRPLFATEIDPQLLRFRDDKEESAHRLLAVEGQVQITVVNDLGKEGIRIEGVVSDKEAHRNYETSFTLDREGRTVDASCTSPQFRRAGLREGPTVPMIALRLLYSRQRADLEKARETEEGRKLIRAETRMLIRRHREEVTIMRVSLNDKKVVVRWGPHPDQMRMSQQFFNRPEDARDEYFKRLSTCADRGFIDASAAETV